MPDLELVLRGAEAEGAIEELARAFEESDIKLTTRLLEGRARADEKAVDPVALASLVLSIPGAALAVWDLADRIRKRARANSLIEAATRLRTERSIDVFAVTLAGHRLLADLDPDDVLELVNASKDARSGDGRF